MPLVDTVFPWVVWTPFAQGGGRWLARFSDEDLAMQHAVKHGGLTVEPNTYDNF